MSTIHPAISVIIPMWNNAPYIAATIESVLAQTFSNFELLILDDKGSDNSREIAEQYCKDSRVKILDHPHNLGYCEGLNRAIKQAKGSYIAILDGDDIAKPERLAKQYAFLEKNQDVGAVGSAAYHLDAHGNITKPHQQPEWDDAIRFQMLFMSAMYQPSSMFRKALFNEYPLHYDSHKKYVYDIDFWAQFGRISQLHNLPEPLIAYRIHHESISNSNRSAINLATADYAKQQWLNYGISEEEAVEIHHAIMHYFDGKAVCLSDLRKMIHTFEKARYFYRKNISRKEAAPKGNLTAISMKWCIKTALYEPSRAKKLRNLAYITLLRPVCTVRAGLYLLTLLRWQKYHMGIA